MRIPYIRTVLSLIGTMAAMSGLLAARSETATTTAPKPDPHVLRPSARTRTVTATPAADALTTATGPAIAITHGVVEVRVTMAGGRIVDVTAASLPHDNEISWTRSMLAASILRDQVLKAQSARVDAVSGATYTSKAYLQSLQAAIDEVDFPES